MRVLSGSKRQTKVEWEKQATFLAKCVNTGHYRALLQLDEMFFMHIINKLRHILPEVLLFTSALIACNL